MLGRAMAGVGLGGLSPFEALTIAPPPLRLLKRLFTLAISK